MICTLSNLNATTRCRLIESSVHYVKTLSFQSFYFRPFFISARLVLPRRGVLPFAFPCPNLPPFPPCFIFLKVLPSTSFVDAAVFDLLYLPPFPKPYFLSFASFDFFACGPLRPCFSLSALGLFMSNSISNSSLSKVVLEVFCSKVSYQSCCY